MPKGRFEDLTGRRYGRLRVEDITEQRQDSHVVWRCRCRCGSIIFVHTSNLTCGNTLSCGCLQRDVVAVANGKRRAWRKRLGEDEAGPVPGKE